MTGTLLLVGLAAFVLCSPRLLAHIANHLLNRAIRSYEPDTEIPDSLVDEFRALEREVAAREAAERRRQAALVCEREGHDFVARYSYAWATAAPTPIIRHGVIPTLEAPPPLYVSCVCRRCGDA